MHFELKIFSNFKENIIVMDSIFIVNTNYVLNYNWQI